MKTRKSNIEVIKKIALCGVLTALLVCIALLTIFFKIAAVGTFQIADGFFLALCTIIPGFGMLVVGVTYSMIIDLINAGFIFIPVTIAIHALMFFIVKGFKVIKLKYLGVIIASLMIYIYIIFVCFVYSQANAINELWVDSIQMGVTIFVGVFLTWLFAKNKLNKILRII